MGKSEEAEYLDYLRADGSTILKRVLNKNDKGVDWIKLFCERFLLSHLNLSSLINVRDKIS
jgi:hypothetical protein